MLTRFAHHRLDAYRVALELFAGVEAFAATLPRGQADLKDQVRRAAAATVRHLAEGANRRLPREKAARFVLARAECGECAAALEMAAVVYLRPRGELLRRADRVAAMCSGLVRREERRDAGTPKPPPARRARSRSRSRSRGLFLCFCGDSPSSRLCAFASLRRVAGA